MKLPLWARALDAVAAMMALLAISVAVTGGFRIFGALISVTDWWRPALLAVIVAIARHAVIRRDALPRRMEA